MDTNEITITFNGQALRFIKSDMGDWVQITNYERNGFVMVPVGYAGYDEDIIILASTRPIANKVYRTVRS